MEPRVPADQITAPKSAGCMVFTTNMPAMYFFVQESKQAFHKPGFSRQLPTAP